MKDKIISFPHLGDYYIPISFLLKKLTNYKIMAPPPITKKTLELGTINSPNFVCIPFKYNLGNFIESLDNGANVIIQAGGGCRYGYYGEVQEKILKDLGYDFEYYNLVENDRVTFHSIYKMFKKIDKRISILKILYYIPLTILMIRFMDNIDEYIRHNIGFEVIENSFFNQKKEMLNSFYNTNGYLKLILAYKKFKYKFKNIKLNKPANPLKIGIIGELYTNMEYFSNYFLEKELAKMGIEIKRFTNLSYLLYQKKRERKKQLKYIKEYCKYTIGADGMDNIYRTKWLIMHHYDGIIHIKPSFCTPEIGAIPIINKVCTDYKMPIIYFSFDSETSETGIKTRLEAFYDMLKSRKDNL